MRANAYYRLKMHYAKRAVWMAERTSTNRPLIIPAHCVKYEELCSDYAKNKQK